MENVSRLERAINKLTVSRRPSSVRQASGEDDSADESFKGALGLNLLRDVTEPLIEFVFVHGLGGGSRKTWSQTSNQYHFWPKEWLSQDSEFGCVRIWSFGYKADWNERKKTTLEIHDFALALLGEVRNTPDIRRSQTKIVFVAHSMGGLVVKQAYMLAREDPTLKDLADRIHTLYFLATPHRGSGQAKTLMNVLKFSYGQKAFVSDLQRNSSLLNSINDSFRHHVEDLQLWSFYETFPCQILLTISAIIVDRSSATLGYTKEHTFPLNADHRGICKFNLPSDPNYKMLRNAFITTIDTILSQISEIASESTRRRHEKLVELTGLSEPPVNELTALDDIRVPDSCTWLISKPTYASWRTLESDSPPIFWLLGNAGAGKSVLCSQVIRTMQQESHRCSYFFFEHEHDIDSSIAGCLRALAYQMAKSDEAILRKVLEVEQDNVPCVQWDGGRIWRKLFVGCIFKVSKPLPQFWVIDALDECQHFSSFLKLIKDVPSYIRIFLTSRSIPEAQQWLTSLGSLVESYHIQSEDIHDDLSIFIESRIKHLPVSDGVGQSNLKAKLLSKSSGSFLWVSLIIKELQQTHSEEDAEAILDEVPENMTRLYVRMLKCLPSSERAVRLTLCLFTWTLLTRRALTLSELRCAIKLDLGQTVHNLGKSLTAICGQFMSIDLTDRVRSVHQTAHIFLLSQDSVPSLVVDEQESHNRIAQACLKILNENQPRRTSLQSPQKGLVGSSSWNELLEYACTSFSAHVQKSLPGDTTTHGLLCTFLETRIPPWIEYLASNEKLYYIIRTAKNLQCYLKRCMRKVGPLSSGRDRLEAWINDLVKVNAKFRIHLTLSPSAIYNLIPALCPLDSMISKTYTSRHRSFIVEGLKEMHWDDCLAMIDTGEKQICAVAFGDRYLAIAVSHGLIYLHYQDSLQVRHKLNFSERPRILLLSNDCAYLVAGGLRKTTIWETCNGTQMWSMGLAHAALSMTLDTEANILSAATQGGYISSWELGEGKELERWKWNESVDLGRGLPRPNRSPGKVLLSPDGNTLAACYRGLPIYLFDLNNKIWTGCCQRNVGIVSQSKTLNEYLVDALAFNPNVETDVLLASYGDGELAIFNKTTNELRQSIQNLFAQALACSPDGSMLVTGSSRGSIRIFEFVGIEGDQLSQVYRINTHDDAIRSLAFGGDSLHFADIGGSHCHIWKPAILVQNDMEEGSQSEPSQGSTFVSESRDAEEGSQTARITAICSDETGDFAFCGRLDGTVGLFETANASYKDVLYRHALNIRIACIVYHKGRSLLMTADESGRILIYKISIRNNSGEVASAVSDISTEEPIQKLLPDPAGNGLVVVSREFATLRTLHGDRKGSPIPIMDQHGDRFVSLHPTKMQYFVVLGRSSFDVYLWIDGTLRDPFIHHDMAGFSFTITPPTPLMPSIPADSQLASIATTPLKYIANHLITPSGKHAVQIWPAAVFSHTASSSPHSSTTPSPTTTPSFLLDPDHLGFKIRQIIATWDTTLLFLDATFWVCSLELHSQELDAKAVKRHFFLLSEWQGGIGSEPFILWFSEAKREVLVGWKERLLVVKNGLGAGRVWGL